MHNEQAYLTPEAEPTYPRKIFFSCLQPAASGGQTPLVLNREFHAALGESTPLALDAPRRRAACSRRWPCHSGDLADKFQRKGGVRYTRNLPDLAEIERQEADGVDVLDGQPHISATLRSWPWRWHPSLTKCSWGQGWMSRGI